MGWLNQPPPPTVADLLPPEVAQKLLDLWLATGANVILCQALSIISDIEEPQAKVMQPKARGALSISENCSRAFKD